MDVDRARMVRRMGRVRAARYWHWLEAEADW